jgi:hypothetical membrane protein
MSKTITTPAVTTDGVPPACTPQTRLTRSLLGYGVLAGPFYVAVSLAQGLTRDGFDLTRHEWSLLANGPGGWIQVVNLILTGLMVIAAAVGFRRALQSGTGARWAPRLLGVYGAGLVAAGVFRPDPMLGFPVGTPDGPPVHPTLHSTLHIAAAGVGFLALVAATLLMGAWFRQKGDSRRAWFARVSGLTFLVAFAGVASGGDSPAVNLAFTAAVVLAWAWLSLTSLDLSRTPA